MNNRILHIPHQCHFFINLAPLSRISEYLSSVIEPYRDDVVCIIKSDVFEHPRVYIHLKHDTFGLPWFEKDTMYKGMEFEKRYSLEDLGL